MRSARGVIFFLSVTASAALALSGCMVNASVENRDAATAPATQSPSASAPSATPSEKPTTTAAPPPITAPAEPLPSAAPPSTSDPAPAPAEPVTFTFPDGRLSFIHPAGWRVEHSQGVASPAVENATVYDASGNEQITIFYSEVGGAVAGPHTRTAFFSEPVPGLQGHSGPAAAHASFYVDRIDGEPHYSLSLTHKAAVSPDGTEGADVVIIGGNRVLAANVVFTGGPFASDEAAKAWFAGAEGQALTAILMSFSYR
jgi:hypothetical protein